MLFRSITKGVKNFIGKRSMNYPLFSSKTVDGIPLWKWARDKKQIKNLTPSKEIEIYTSKIRGKEMIAKESLKKYIFNRIDLLSGDFRQGEIKKEWLKFFKKTKNKQFFVFHIRITCSSGTYMRVLAEELGNKIGVPSLALSITRNKIEKIKNCYINT